MNKKNWVHECRTKAQVYLKVHKLPTHPNLTNKTKNNTGNNNDNNNDNNNNNNNNNTQGNSSNQTQTNEDEQEGANETWPTPHNGFEIIVDSKQLCDSINGTATLDYDNEQDYNTCNNIADKLIRTHQLGLNPAHKHLNPIEWRRRALNKGADKWCNQVLDQQHSTYNQYNINHNTQPPQPNNPNNTQNNNNPHNNINNNNNNNNNSYNPNTTLQWPNIFMQTDGGCRYKGYSSTGWRIFTEAGGNTTLIAEGGTLHVGDTNSFIIECRALDEALEVLLNNCENPLPDPHQSSTAHTHPGGIFTFKGQRNNMPPSPISSVPAPA